MTVQQLSENMTSAELTEWAAVDLYFQPLSDSWREAGTVAAATLAPHAPRGKQVNPDDFIPLAKLPQTEAEMQQELEKLRAAVKGGD